MKLTEFAGKNPTTTGSKPWYQMHLTDAQIKEVVKGYRSGIPKTTIAKWLKSEGHSDVTTGKIDTLIEREA